MTEEALLSITTLTKLQMEELDAQAKAKKINDRRRRVYKSWFKRNFEKRFTTHTASMNPVPDLTNWVYTKKLDDTYRGSPKDTNTSGGSGEHGYGPVTRLTWSNVVVQMGIDIVLDSRDLLTPFMDGKTISTKLIVEWVEEVTAEGMNELVDKYQPGSRDQVVVSIKFPDDMPVNPTIKQLKEADLTMGFSLVAR